MSTRRKAQPTKVGTQKAKQPRGSAHRAQSTQRAHIEKHAEFDNLEKYNVLDQPVAGMDFNVGIRNPMPPVNRVPLNLTPSGTPGLRHAGGYVIEEFLRKLIGRPGVQQWREIFLNSAQIGAILYFITALIRRVPWRFDPNPESTNKDLAAQHAEFFEQCMHDMEHTWHSFIEEACTYLMFGWSMFEKIYKYRRGPRNVPELRSRYNDGKVGWREFAVRSQDTLLRWEIQRETGIITGMWQQDPYSGNPPIYLGKEYCIHFRNRPHKQNPEGISLFRNSVIPYLRLKRIEEIEAIGIERDLTGLLVMEVPPTLLSGDPNTLTAQDMATRTELESLLMGIKADERAYAMIPAELDTEGKPTQFKLRLLQGGGQKQLDIVRIKENYISQIYQTALVQFLLLGQQQNGGSYSLASSSTSLAAMAIGAIMANVRDTLQREAVEPLAVLNQIDATDTPVLAHGDIEKQDLKDVAAYIQTLFTTGTLQPSEKLTEWLHKLGGDMPYDVTDKGMATGSAEEQQLTTQLGGEEKQPKPAEPSRNIDPATAQSKVPNKAPKPGQPDRADSSDRMDQP